MLKNVEKRRKKRRGNKRWIYIFLILLILFISGFIVGRLAYLQSVSVCDTSISGQEKEKNRGNNVVPKSSIVKKDKQTIRDEKEQVKNEDFKRQEELKEEEEKKGQPKAENKKPEEAVVITTTTKNNNNNYEMSIQDVYKKDGKKTAFLTFDDGPTRNITPEVLDTLKKYNAKGTFFVLGKMADQNKDLIQRIVKEGHAIANHGYSHEYGNIYSSRDSFWEEINKTEGVLKAILGKEFSTRVFRFPGGSKGGHYESFKATLRTSMENKGYFYVDWNVENGDGLSSNLTPDRQLENVKRQVSAHEHIVVLMHDAATKKTTAEALPRIIEYLRSQGYEFKVLR